MIRYQEVEIDTRTFTEQQENQFIILAKKAGFTLKQIEQEVTFSADSLSHKWKKIPLDRSPTYLKVRKRHKGTIIELILMSVDIFEISSIFNYNPKTVLKFIEKTCLDDQWQIKKCGTCKNQFVAFGRTIICQKTSCKRAEKSRRDKYRHLKRIYAAF